MEMATHNGVFVAGGNQTTIDHLTAEQLRHYTFAFPPFDEQARIAETLTEKLSSLKRASGTVKRSVERLTEYRAALVTAAVTGQIADLV